MGYRESEDEGVWLEGDAGFSWEDTRCEQWRWEAEQGIWEDETEGDDDQEQDYQDKYQATDEDNAGVIPAEEEEEEWG